LYILATTTNDIGSVSYHKRSMGT